MCVFEALFLRTYTKISWEPVFDGRHTFSPEKRILLSLGKPP